EPLVDLAFLVVGERSQRRADVLAYLDAAAAEEVLCRSLEREAVERRPQLPHSFELDDPLREDGRQARDCPRGALDRQELLGTDKDIQPFEQVGLDGRER